MARALKIADKQIDELKHNNMLLEQKEVRKEVNV